MRDDSIRMKSSRRLRTATTKQGGAGCKIAAISTALFWGFGWNGYSHSDKTRGFQRGRSSIWHTILL